MGQDTGQRMAEGTRNWVVLVRTFQWGGMRKWEKRKLRLASRRQERFTAIVLPARGVREGSQQQLRPGLRENESGSGLQMSVRGEGCGI